MGEELTVQSEEKARVLQALLDQEEQVVLREFRELRESGFGRLEVIVVENRIEGINPTRTLKRKDLGLPPKTA